MRRAAVMGMLLISAGCQSIRVPPGVNAPGVGVLVQGAAGRCTPVVVGSVVRRVCLPPPAAPDTAATAATADAADTR
jgi:hypothetical protein